MAEPSIAVRNGNLEEERFKKIQSSDWKKVNEAKRILKLENEMLKAKQNMIEERPLALLERIAVALEKIANAP
jgi:hypothetical protein